jgi:hypothetical protein
MNYAANKAKNSENWKERITANIATAESRRIASSAAQKKLVS